MQEPGKALWVQCGMLSVLLLSFGNTPVSGTHGLLQVAHTVWDVFEANTHPFAVHIHQPLPPSYECTLQHITLDGLHANSKYLADHKAHQCAFPTCLRTTVNPVAGPNTGLI